MLSTVSFLMISLGSVCAEQEEGGLWIFLGEIGGSRDIRLTRRLID